MAISTDSEVRFVVRQSFLNYGFFILVVGAFTLFSIYLTFLYPWSMQTIWSSEFVSLKIPLFALIPLALFAHLLHLVLDKKMVFTDSYILFLEGLMSWKEKSIRAHYFNIKEIEIDQTIYQRIFGLGDLTITTVATQIESALMMPGIRNSRQIKDFINERMVSQLEEKNNATAKDQKVS